MSAGLIQRGVDALKNNVNLVKSGIEDTITTKLRSNADAKYYEGQDPQNIENVKNLRNQVLKNSVKGEYRPFIQDMNVGSRFTGGAAGPHDGTVGQSNMPGDDFNKRFSAVLPGSIRKSISLSKYGTAYSPGNINVRDDKYYGTDPREVFLHETAHEFFDKKVREDPSFIKNFAMAWSKLPETTETKEIQDRIQMPDYANSANWKGYSTAMTEAYARYVSAGNRAKTLNEMPESIRPYYYWMK